MNSLRRSGAGAVSRMQRLSAPVVYRAAGAADSPLAAVAAALAPNAFNSSASAGGRCRFMSSASSTLGIVDVVTNDNVYVQSLGASPFTIATFQNGASGIVTDITRTGTHISLIYGSVLPTETVTAEKQPASLRVSTSFLGRVIGPLGDPLDGQGPISHSLASKVQALLASTPPGIPARAPLRATLASGSKCIDSFFPLLRGSSVAVTGESGSGKRALVESVLQQIARSNAEAEECGTENPPVVCVYVSVGKPVAAVRSLAHRLHASGVMGYTVLIAAPEGCNAGAAFLAPFAGAAVAEYFRDSGRHALVVYDDLNAHHGMARRVSRSGWAGTAAVPSFHPALFERCAQLGEDRGGGSLTCLALLESVPSGSAYLQLEHMKSRELVANTASLADGRWHLARGAVKAQALLPLEFEEIVGRPGHAAQGPALAYYSNRLRDVLSEVRETARGASLAIRLGVALESETDVMLDLHAKARTLLLPTQGMLQAIADARHSGTDVSVETVAHLGLAGLSYVRVEGTNIPQGAGAQGGGDREGADTVATVTAMLAAQEAATASRKASVTALGSVSSVVQKGMRQFSTTSQLWNSEGSSGPKKPVEALDERIHKLKSKMDSDQIRTLTAVRESRAKMIPKKGGFSAAEAYFAAQKAGLTAAQAADQVADRVDDEKQESTWKQYVPKPPVEVQKEYDSIYDVPDDHETFGTAKPIISIPEAGLGSDSGSGGNGTGSVSSGPVKPAWWSALSGKPPGTRSFSTGGQGTKPRPSRLPFRAPSGQTPPPPLFTDTFTRAPDHAPAPWHAWQWHKGPNAGDPARTLLSLFILSHGYVARVPLPYLLSYERGLYELLAALPAPVDEGCSTSSVEDIVRACGPGGGGVQHAPYSTMRAGYVTLLDAALLAPVPAAMVESARPHIASALCESALLVMTRTAAAAAEHAAAQALAAEAEEERRRQEEGRGSGTTSGTVGRGWTSLFSGSWRTFTAPPSVAEPMALPVADVSSAAPVVHEPPVLAAGTSLDSLLPYVLTDGPLLSLPIVWQAMHVAVAEYTRTFNGDPKL